MKGTQAGKPLHTNVVQKGFDHSAQRAGEPKDQQIRISYGEICEVDHENSTVRIDVFGRGSAKTRLGAGPDGLTQGIFVPIMQSLDMIHILFGSLRKGLIVRIFWNGKHQPGSDSIVEVVSDAGSAIFSSGKKKPISNEIATGPHDLFTGGMTSF